MASKASHDLAACPRPPYTTSSSGFSATSGSRLFSRQRSAASWSHPLARSVDPLAARTVRTENTVPTIPAFAPPLSRD